jgi:hypothetical protein
MAGFEERGWPVDVCENLTDFTEFAPSPPQTVDFVNPVCAEPVAKFDLRERFAHC